MSDMGFEDKIFNNENLIDKSRVTIYDEKGNFIAIGRVDLENNNIKPLKVFVNEG